MRTLRTVPISCGSTGVILCCCHHRPLAAHQTFPDLLYSTRSFPVPINSFLTDKIQDWKSLPLDDPSDTAIKKHTFTYLKQLLPFGLWAEISVQPNHSPCNDCSCPRRSDPKGTVYFFPTSSAVQWLNDQVLDPDSLGSNLCSYNLVIDSQQDPQFLAPSLLNCKVGWLVTV